MKKIIITMLLTINVVFSSAFAIEQTVTREDTDLEKLKMGEDISIQSYSASFAKRMGLPKSKYGEPKEPIKGYEFRITRVLDGKYECRLNVYFDNAIDFKYPEGDVGSVQLIFHKILKFPKMNRSDGSFIRKIRNKYSMNIHIASDNYVAKKQGFRTNLHILYYRKNLLNDVGFITLFIPNCSFLISPNNRDLNTNLWFEKSTGKDYTLVRIKNPDDFNKYRLPRIFQKEILNLSEKARLKNSDIRQTNKNKR